MQTGAAASAAAPAGHAIAVRILIDSVTIKGLELALPIEKGDQVGING